MPEPLIFYDIPSTLVGTWSPNLWKVRYALNFKGLEYKTVYVEYPDIEPLCIKLGVQSTDTKPDGVTPHYTLPVLQDPSTGAVIADSAKIAMYLDEQYPETPRVFAPGTYGLYLAMLHATIQILGPLFPFALPASAEILNPSSQEYFYTTREVMFGKSLKALYPAPERQAEEWKSVEKAFTKISQWFEKDSLYIMGTGPTFGDFMLAGYVMWIKQLWGDDSSISKITIYLSAFSVFALVASARLEDRLRKTHQIQVGTQIYLARDVGAAVKLIGTVGCRKGSWSPSPSSHSHRRHHLKPWQRADLYHEIH